MTVAMVELYRLLRRFEKGPVKVGGVPWPRTDEGAALKAYLCPAGKWTIAFGCTKHRDGTPIAEGDTITPDLVYPYTEAAVARVLGDIKRIVKRPLNAHQQAALADFVFNLGGEQLRTSPRLLPAIEEGRWEDAADIMGDYYRAWGKKEGKWHRMAMYGLRIRRFAAGCVLLGLDWEEACNEENISFPKKLEWQEGWTDGTRTGGRYFDVVQPEATPFMVVHRLAAAHPLSPATQPAPEAKPAPALIPDTPAAPPQAAAKGDGASLATQPVSAPPAPEQKPAASTSSGPSRDVAAPEAPKAAAPAKVPPAIIPVPEKPKEPVVITPKTIDVKAIPYGEVDPTQATNMSGSRRVAGMVVVGLGSMTQILAAREIVSSSVGAVFYDMSRDPIVVALLIGGVFWVVGWLTRKRGTQIVAKGMAGAQTLLK